MHAKISLCSLSEDFITPSVVHIDNTSIIILHMTWALLVARAMLAFSYNITSVEDVWKSASILINSASNFLEAFGQIH